MKTKNIQSPQNIFAYIERCLNDFEAGISTKNKTYNNILDIIYELLDQLRTKTKKK